MPGGYPAAGGWKVGWVESSRPTAVSPLWEGGSVKTVRIGNGCGFWGDQRRCPGPSGSTGPPRLLDPGIPGRANHVDPGSAEAARSPGRICQGFPRCSATSVSRVKGPAGPQDHYQCRRHEPQRLCRPGPGHSRPGRVGRAKNCPGRGRRPDAPAGPTVGGRPIACQPGHGRTAVRHPLARGQRQCLPGGASHRRGPAQPASPS